MKCFSLEDAAIKPVGDSVETPKQAIEPFHNHVYFYNEVNSNCVLDMIKRVREVDEMLRSERASRSVPYWIAETPIWLHIQSGGGSLFAGFSAADQLATIQTPVYSIIEGYCCSAATLISMACSHRLITANSFMMIHQLSNSMWGKYEDFKDEMHMMDMAMDRVVKFYTKRTKLNKKKVRKLLERDSWFDAKGAIKLGLADEIYEA